MIRQATASWPDELHGACTTRRLAEGHQPAYAELHGAIDVLRLARVTYPRFSIEDALRRLCKDQVVRHPDVEHVRAGGGPGRDGRSLEDHRTRRARRA